MSVAGEISETGEVIYENLTPKKINSLLNSLKTRAEGLQLLNSYLPECPVDDFIKYCVSWMQNCCKIDDFVKNRDYGFKLLGTLIQISSNYQELKKSVSFFITTRYFDYVLKYFLNSEVGWACTEICMSLYRGACGSYQETLEKQLKNELEKSQKISLRVARCFALLPSIGGGGNEKLNYFRNWKTQFKKYINACHLILNNLFVDVEELQEFESSEDFDWIIVGSEKNPEQLTVQLYNYCSILNQMLLSQYPTAKAVPSDLVFQLVCRGLAINPKSFENRQTTDIIAIQKILPEVHIILLSLLKALIVTCKNQLLPYAYLVCKLLRQSLEWTHSESNQRGEEPFEQVRISAYETLCNWLAATRSGGCVESISNVVIMNAAADVSMKKEVVVLKEAKQKVRHRDKEQGSRQVSLKSNGKLSFAALKALQFLLKFEGALLKPEDHKFLQEFTIKLLVNVQKNPTSDMPIPFSVSKCRKELYSLLLELVQHPCPKWPPPTNFALRLFRKGVADECVHVSFLCSSALSFAVNLIHPQYTNEGFPFDEATDTRRKLTSEAIKVDVHFDKSECENHREETSKSNNAEKINRGDKPECSVGEDSVTTEIIIRDVDDNEVSETPTEKLSEEPSPKKPKMTSEMEQIASEKMTPQKNFQAIFEGESKKSDDSDSLKSVPLEGNEEIKPKKSYFLRSKVTEVEENTYKLRNSLKVSVKTTPRRPRTRGSSKMESESETESKTTKKSEDDDDDIIAVFDDSVIE